MGQSRHLPYRKTDIKGPHWIAGDQQTELIKGGVISEPII